MGKNDMNWSLFYKDLQNQAKVPNATIETIEESHAVFSDMYLDLGVIKQTITDSNSTPLIVTIYADVLNIPDNLNWLLDQQALVIKARKIQCGTSATILLDFRSNMESSLVLYTHDLIGTLNAEAIYKGNQTPPKVFTLSKPLGSMGIQIKYEDNQAEQVLLSWAQGIAMSPGSDLKRSLSTSFIFGSLLYDQNPEVALGIMTWLKDWSSASPELLDMFLRSSSLVALLSSRIQAKENGATFVPYLTKSVYTDVAKSFISEAQQYEDDYRQLSTQKVLTDENIQLAKTLLDNKIYQSDYVNQLEEQAKSNYENAVATVNAVLTKYNEAVHKSQMTEIDFKEIGLPEYKRKVALEAAFKIVTSLVTFGAAIAAMAVGQEEAAPAAAAGVAEGAAAAEEAAAAGSEIASLAKDLVEVMKVLKKTVEALQKVYTFSSEVITAANDIGSAGSLVSKLQSMETNIDGIDMSDTSQWQIFKLRSDDVLAEPIKLGIQYANDYMLSLDEVAIYGQSLSAAQLAVIRTGQEYARVLMQKEMAAQQQARLTQYVESLKVGEEPIVEMMHQFYQRYIDAKSSLFSALQEYRASYFYWALKPSLVQPKIIDSVKVLGSGLHDITAINLDLKTALEDFDSPPQTMTEKNHVITDKAILTSLIEKGTTSFVLPLDDTQFIGLNRVRLTRVRAWLAGVKNGSNTSINVTIRTTGNYQDRLDGVNYQFTAKPLHRTFEYIVNNQQTGSSYTFGKDLYGHVEVDGDVDNEVRYAYFEPTPFSLWTIALDKDINPGIDISGLTSITMEFAGSIIDNRFKS